MYFRYIVYYVLQSIHIFQIQIENLKKNDFEFPYCTCVKRCLYNNNQWPILHSTKYHDDNNNLLLLHMFISVINHYYYYSKP